MCKRNGIKPFRDPSQYGNDPLDFIPEVLNRSNYPQVIDSHRNGNIDFSIELPYYNRIDQKIIRFIIRKVKGSR